MTIRRWLSALTVLVVSTAAAFLVVQSLDLNTRASDSPPRPHQGQDGQTAEVPSPAMTKAPACVSRVESVSVTKVELVDAGTDDASVEVTITNIDTKSISQINFSLGQSTDYWEERVTPEGDLAPLLARDQSITISIPAINIEPTGIVVVSGILFVDGSCKGSTEALDKIRLRRSTQPHPAQGMKPATESRPNGEVGQ